MTVQNGDSGDQPKLPHVQSGSDSNVSNNALLLRVEPQQQPSQQPPQPNKDEVGAETPQVELPKSNETDLIPSPFTTSSMTGDASTDRSQTFWGYIDAKKITERTGIAIEHFVTFGIKEIVDNSCDDLENNPTSLLWTGGSPTVVVHITKDKDLLQIVIRNLNRGNKISFYADRLIRIFNYNRFHSSKGGNVSRGQLGDALKEILTMAYALTNSRDETGTGEDKQWNGVLVIRHNKTEFKLGICVDRKNERIIPVFSPEITDDSIDGYTEIEFTMLIIFESINMRSIIQFCKKYTLTPTHIGFDFNFLDNDKGWSGRFTTPVTHVISSNFRNPRSVYCHDLRDFQNFTYSIPNRSETVHDALVSRDFRESNYNYFRDHLGLAIGDTTTVERLRNSDRSIKQVFDLLRRNMQPMRTLSVSYTLDYRRKNALLDRFESIKPDSLVIDREEAR